MDPMSQPQPQPAPPRALAHTTGLLFQLAGSLISIAACCWWSFAGHWSEAVRPVAPDQVAVDVFKDATTSQWWGMIAVCASLAGGLALLAAGIALQHDM